METVDVENQNGVEVAGSSCPPIERFDGDSTDPRYSMTGLSFQDLVAFDGSEHLLRGIRLAKVMRGCGRIFRSSRGSSSTYQLSETVDSLSYFISHNWAVPRAAKHVALAFKFNLHLAMFAGCLTMALGCVLGILGLLPTMEAIGSEYRMGYLTRMCTIPAILVALFFGGDLVCWKSPVANNHFMFLDKACIHQEDKQLQKAGIRKLGAFLRSSERMLALVTPLYLKKLWTVYEVASFLSVHDISQLGVVPIMLPIAFVLFLALMYGHQFFMVAVHAWGVPNWLHWLVNAFGSLAYLGCIRFWARSKVEIQRSIANFSVHEAQCEFESDREIVYENIAALQKACGRVPWNASQDQALEVFDEHVRRVLSMHFEKVFGRLCFTQSEYFIIGIVVAGAIHVDHWVRVGDGQPFREALGERSMDFFFELFAIPVWALTLEAVAGCYLSPAWLSWKDIAFTLIANTFASCVGNGLMVLQHWWAERAKFDDGWLLGAVVISVMLVSLRFYVIGRYGSLHRAGWKSTENSPAPPPLQSTQAAPFSFLASWSSSSSSPSEKATGTEAAATAATATAAASHAARAATVTCPKAAAVLALSTFALDGGDDYYNEDPKSTSTSLPTSLPTTSLDDFATDNTPAKPEKPRDRIIASL